MSTLGDSDFTLDESEPLQENKESELELSPTEHSQSSNVSDIMLDPYNAQHMEWMQQQIINLYSQDLDDSMSVTTAINDPKSRLITDDGGINGLSYSSVIPITAIKIQPSEYRDIDDFNRYLSEILINIIKYAEMNNQLFRMNGHKYRQKGINTKKIIVIMMK